MDFFWGMRLGIGMGWRAIMVGIVMCFGVFFFGLDDYAVFEGCYHLLNDLCDNLDDDFCYLMRKNSKYYLKIKCLNFF